jgi:hypothetical protein
LLLLPLLSPGGSLAASGPGGPRQTAETPTPATSRAADAGGTGLDLAAMGARPSDLDDVGLTGYDETQSYPGFALGAFGVTLILDPAQKTRYWDKDAGERMAADGFKQFVAVTLDVYSSAGELGYFDTQMTEFGTATSAHKRWRELADSALATDAREPTPTAVELPAIGDESRYVQVDVTTDGYAEAALVFRVGAVVASLNFTQQNFAGVERLPDQMASLAGVVLSRIKRGNQAAPGLANHVVALRARADLIPSPILTDYLRIDGVTIPVDTERPNDVASRDGGYAQSGSDDVLYADQGLYNPADTSQPAVDFSISLSNFDTAAHASAQLNSVVEDDANANPAATIEVDSAYSVGDGAVAFTVTGAGGNGQTQRVADVDFRVGAIYASVELASTSGTVNVTAAEEIATKEAACLAGAGPCGLIDAPAGIIVAAQPAP